MQTFLFFTPTSSPLPQPALEDALAGIPGLVFDGAPGAPYRPGRWRDPVTGGRMIFDLGTPPIEDDPLHPPRQYAGYTAVPLAAHLPPTGPHWLVVESLRPIEALLTRCTDVDLRALDTEDIQRDPDSEPGPYPWHRPRVIASWQHQHDLFSQTRIGIPRMARGDSLLLWRYRRERPLGIARHAGVWPEALVLGSTRASKTAPSSSETKPTSEAKPTTAEAIAYGAAFWRDPEVPFAVPPLPLLIVPRANGACVIPADLLRLAAQGTELAEGRALLIHPTPATRALHASAAASSTPMTGYTALDDEDWSD